MFTSADLQAHNRVNCKFWQETVNVKGGVCDNPEAWKHFKWPGPGAMRPGKMTCASCPVRSEFVEGAPSILGAIKMDNIPQQPIVPIGRKLDRPSWWKRKALEVGGNLFGPAKWKKLHEWSITADLMDVDRWLKNFAIAELPCGACREHFLKMIRDNPPITKSNKELARWTFERHNQVNREKESPSPEITWNEAVQLQNWPIEWIEKP
jgi:hypothetical protein